MPVQLCMKSAKFSRTTLALRNYSGLAAFQSEYADDLSTMGPFNLQIKTPFINIDKYCNLSNSFLPVKNPEPDGLTDRHHATEFWP
jgi:hypothetical protein